MFPHTKLQENELQELLQCIYLGDVVEKAGELSLAQFKNIQSGKVGYRLADIADAVVDEALRSQTMKGIPFEQQQKFLAMASDRQQFKRAIIHSVINHGGNHLNLTRAELVLLNGCLLLSPLFDQLFIAWREVVVYSPLAQIFAKQPDESTVFRQAHNFLQIPYVYAVILQAEDMYKEVSLLEAFPVFVKRIIETLRALSKNLTLADADAEVVEYIDALADFYENKDVSKYEFFSKNVDALWVRLTGRIIPIHPMEVYEDPGKYCVSPEFGVGFVDERYNDVNDGIRKTAASLITCLQNRYPGSIALEKSIPLMRKADARVYTMVAEAGARLVLRPFGQNIPNWPEVRQSEGVRIFIDMNTAQLRWNAQKEGLLKVFGEAIVQELSNDLPNLMKYAAMVNVGGHEVAHNAFVLVETQNRITPPLYAKLEETKASFAILAFLDAIYTPEEIRNILLYELASNLRNIAMSDDLSKIAYVYTAYASIQSFIHAGIIEKSSKGYVLNASERHLHAYLENLKEKFDKLQAVYEEGDALDAQDFIDTYFVRTSEIDALSQLL